MTCCQSRRIRRLIQPLYQKVKDMILRVVGAVVNTSFTDYLKVWSIVLPVGERDSLEVLAQNPLVSFRYTSRSGKWCRRTLRITWWSGPAVTLLPPTMQ
eukprot:3937363-Rhodomonas_salina.4